MKFTTAEKVLAAKSQASSFRVFCFPLNFMMGPSIEYRGGEVQTLEPRGSGYMVLFKRDEIDIKEGQSRRAGNFQRVFGPIYGAQLQYQSVTPSLQDRVDALLETHDKFSDLVDREIKFIVSDDE